MEQQVSAGWRKSSFSSGNGGACLEAGQAHGTILIRDTTQHGHGPVLRLTPRDFTRLVESVR